MRIVFVGSSRFGLSALNAISTLEGVTIVGVLTNPEAFKISYSQSEVKNVLHANFSDWALTHATSCYVMEGNMQEPALGTWLEELRPDLMVVVGWYHMIPKSLRHISPAIGLHASLLPDYSGGAPLVWAMINGEDMTGITLFEMSDGVDNGPIYGQASTTILEDDTIASLYRRIETMGIDLLQTFLPRIASGTAEKRIQDETLRRIVPQRSPSHGRIDWLQSSREIYNFVRAQSMPYPGAFSSLAGKQITIWAVRVSEGSFEKPPGSIVVLDGRLFITCGDGGGVEVLSMADKTGDLTIAAWIAVHQILILSGVKFE
jgi:methionyl-tRNA formyltransferase